MDAELAGLLHAGDLDGLVREVDRRCALGDHAGVDRLREACREVTAETGKQLWGPAQYAEYRLALEAPAPLAASVVLPGAGRFALGPLTEVVAQHHAFDELADHLHAPVRASVAQERILRGEDLTDDPRADLDDVGLPGVLQPWEPAYPLPTYRATERLDGGPAPVGGAGRPAPAPAGRALAWPALEAALLEPVAAWREESAGVARVAVVEGDAAAAVAALELGPVRLVPLATGPALARLAGAAASGGALGRRRGGAAGREQAWWVAHVATASAFPAEPQELGRRLARLRWFAAGDEDAEDGRVLRLAVEGGHGAGARWAAAVVAHDRGPAGAR